MAPHDLRDGLLKEFDFCTWVILLFMHQNHLIFNDRNVCSTVFLIFVVGHEALFIVLKPFKVLFRCDSVLLKLGKFAISLFDFGIIKVATIPGTSVFRPVTEANVAPLVFTIRLHTRHMITTLVSLNGYFAFWAWFCERFQPILICSFTVFVDFDLIFPLFNKVALGGQVIVALTLEAGSVATRANTSGFRGPALDVEVI